MDYRCKKCGCTHFIAETDDVYYLTLKVDEDDNTMIVNVDDMEVERDVTALTIKCQSCKTVPDTDAFDDWRWSFDDVDDD